MEETVRSIHPYQPYIPEDATKLIIGTMPPFRFCASGGRALYHDDVDFYYGSRDNYFWKLLSEVTGTPLEFANTTEAVNQRKQLLQKLHMGITDIIGSCIHRNGKSDDASLLSIQPKPLDKLLLEHPKIEALIYTSRSEVKKQINRFFAHKGPHPKTNEHAWEESVWINSREYAVIRLYSPSPIALWSVSADTRLKQYQCVFSLPKPTHTSASQACSQ